MGMYFLEYLNTKSLFIFCCDLKLLKNFQYIHICSYMFLVIVHFITLGNKDGSMVNNSNMCSSFGLRNHWKSCIPSPFNNPRTWLFRNPEHRFLPTVYLWSPRYFSMCHNCVVIVSFPLT